MEPRKLSDDNLKKIILYFKSVIDANVYSKEEGREIAYKTLVERTDFLPKNMQQFINENKGDNSQEDYLILHNDFEEVFAKYRS